MLATTQEKIQMKMLLEAAEKKAATLATQQKKLNDVMKKSDDLISQMLPKSVAEELAKGKTNEEICKTYECVTMLFSDIVTFTVICSKLKPLQVDILHHSCAGKRNIFTLDYIPLACKADRKSLF